MNRFSELLNIARNLSPFPDSPQVRELEAASIVGTIMTEKEALQEQEGSSSDAFSKVTAAMGQAKIDSKDSELTEAVNTHLSR